MSQLCIDFGTDDEFDRAAEAFANANNGYSEDSNLTKREFMKQMIAEQVREATFYYEQSVAATKAMQAMVQPEHIEVS